jgi:hypothetical protein
VVEAPKGAHPARTNDLAFFTLADMGAAAGLARWVALCRNNRRVVQPLLNYHRHGSATADDHILAMAAAMEYWAASNKGAPGWSDTGGKSGGLGKLMVVANRAGSEWARFVGDVDRWANSLWNAYNDAKHFRPSKLSNRDKVVLAQSASILLTCALLDAAAGSKKCSRSYLRTHYLNHLGKEIRAL